MKEREIESEVLNMEEVHWKILNLMGEEYENIYLYAENTEKTVP